jgi:hypothetical protein
MAGTGGAVKLPVRTRVAQSPTSAQCGNLISGAAISAVIMHQCLLFQGVADGHATTCKNIQVFCLILVGIGLMRAAAALVAKPASREAGDDLDNPPAF